jgi:hypothetical protein
MPSTAARIRSVLAAGSAWQALEVAIAAAQDAGRRAIAAHPGLPPAEQFALALQAADKALEGLAVELTGEEGEHSRDTDVPTIQLGPLAQFLAT